VRCSASSTLKGQSSLKLVAQGTLSERIPAAGAGIGGFFTRTGADTTLSKGKERRVIDGHDYVFETPLHADLALIKGYRADRWGNLVYRKTARNYGPAMATAAELTVVEVDAVVELGELDPEAIITPGIYVDRVWEIHS
jgi:3-oxoadipate CoA-transferase alpha subunit